MNSTRTDRPRRLAIVLLFGASVACVAWLLQLGTNASSRSESRRLLAKECHPVWREFESGAFKQGDSLEKLLVAHTPAWQRSLGEVTVCEFRPPINPAVHLSPVRVTAVRGKLVSAIAGSCNWWHTFFDATEASPTLCALAPSRQN